MPVPEAPHAATGALIDAHTLDAATGALFSGRVARVGWGSGSVFDYFHTLYPVPLDALIDNDSSRWGSSRRGVPIVGPSQLDALPDGALIIIYSAAWPEIRRQVLEHGRHMAVPASGLFADAATRARLAWSERLAAAASPAQRPSRDHAVVVQGPIVPGVTARVLSLTRRCHPTAQIVLSTWNDTPPPWLDAVAPLCHALTVSPRPASAGVQNRNAQIVSTQAGLRRAGELGARQVLKIRTDLAVLADGLFERAARLRGALPTDAARAHGLTGRLLVPSSFTRKYLLYHASDLVMLGAIEDLARYWSAPLDPREGQLLSAEWTARPLDQANLAGQPSESYLGTAFCRTIGWSARGTLADSWRYYRDLFAVVDNDWLDLLWFKQLSIPDAALRDGIRSPVTHAFWERLLDGDPEGMAAADPIDPSRFTLGALSGLAA